MSLYLSGQKDDSFKEQTCKVVNAEISEKAPRCHMRPMFLDGAEDPWSEAWFECAHCGHTKPV